MKTILTPRETEVMQEFARGLTGSEIAKKLCISPKTLKKHIEAVLSKTETDNRCTAMIKCIELGLIRVSIR